jgi:hypothetical protein
VIKRFQYKTLVCFRCCPSCSASLHLLYQLKLGFYTSSIVTYVKWDVPRKDFAATFTHHIATALLIGMSLHYE